MMIYLIRHGESNYDEAGQKIYQGFGIDLCPLSEEGIIQIEKTSEDEHLKGTDLILSSPYTRALQSAAILSRKLNAPIRVETDLHEWLANKDYVYEDDETAYNAYMEYKNNHGNYPDNETRKWESAQLIRERVNNVLKKYTSYRKVIVTCHGMMMQALTDIEHPDNGQIVEYRL